MKKKGQKKKLYYGSAIALSSAFILNGLTPLSLFVQKPSTVLAQAQEENGWINFNFEKCKEKQDFNVKAKVDETEKTVTFEFDFSHWNGGFKKEAKLMGVNGQWSPGKGKKLEADNSKKTYTVTLTFEEVKSMCKEGVENCKKGFKIYLPELDKNKDGKDSDCWRPCDKNGVLGSGNAQIPDCLIKKIEEVEKMKPVPKDPELEAKKKELEELIEKARGIGGGQKIYTEKGEINKYSKESIEIRKKIGEAQRVMDECKKVTEDAKNKIEKAIKELKEAYDAYQKLVKSKEEVKPVPPAPSPAPAPTPEEKTDETNNVNRKELSDLIDKVVSSLPVEDIISSEELKEALGKARMANEKLDPTKEEIDKAKKGLEEAYNKIVKPAEPEKPV
ncbi:hypothetical protein ABGF25_05855, partial [Helcococcus ovis]